jgi:hypothetical protein
MKFSPPGAEPYRTLTRVDGWLGNDPSGIPYSVAREIAAALPRFEGRTEVERIRSRMLARQMAYARPHRLFRNEASGYSRPGHAAVLQAI